IWVTNFEDNTVSKLLASNGSVAGTYSTVSQPRKILFDGSHIWISALGFGLAKIRPSDGSTVSITQSFSPGPNHLVFDGSSLWATVGRTSLETFSTSDGTSVALHEYPWGGSVIDAVFVDPYIWVSDFDNGDYLTAGVVRVISPQDGRVVMTYSPDDPYLNSFALVFDGTYVWVSVFPEWGDYGYRLVRLPVPTG
ncbi:MAG: hypothetical protein VB861_08315, partial [Planctomycetaceae bacterium]